MERSTRRGAQALVRARAADGGGVRLDALADCGQRVSLWLDAKEGMTLADELHKVCEKPCWDEQQALV